MTIDKQNILKLYRLAKLSPNEEEVEMIAKELGSILAMVESLQKLNTDDVEPLFSVLERSLELREDIVLDHDLSAEIAKIAPAFEYNFFKVPKVVE